MAADHYSTQYRHATLLSLVWLGGSLLVLPVMARGQSNIIPDQTLGKERSQVQIQNNGIDQISGGATRGQNLFHSFKTFNVAENRGAYFLSENTVKNILTRVTGGDASNILGTLGTLNPANPNLFLMNPNGIVFGKNAKLDIGGSFLATTANAIQLGKSGLFSASQPQTSQLMTVQPSALFFSELNQAASIVNRANSAVFPSGQSINGLPALRGLQANDGKSLIFVGSDIYQENGLLRAPKGHIELASVSGAGTVGLTAANGNLQLIVPQDIERGDILFTDGSFAIIAGESQGQIVVNARTFDLLDRSGLVTRLEEGTSGTQTANITVNATKEINLASFSDSIFGSIIGNAVLDNAIGDAGDITIETPVLEGRGNVAISSIVRGQGNSGNITIQASDRVDFAQRLGTEASGISSAMALT